MPVEKMLDEAGSRGLEPRFEWDFMRQGLAQRCLILAGFGLALGLLIALGYGLRDPSENLTVMWPATGLLFMALWTSPRRNWIWILAIQILVQGTVYFAFADTANWRWDPVFALANSLDALVGAIIARRLVPSITTPHVGPILKFLAAITLGCATGALVGAYASIHTSAGTHFARQWQLWWTGSWLGSLFIFPMMLSWAVKLRHPQLVARLPRPADFALTAGALLGMTYWTFSSVPGVLTSIFQSPLLVLALAVVIAFRMPPRWATTFTALSVLMAVYYTSRHLGPYSAQPTAFARIASVQLSTSALIIVNFILVIGVYDTRRALLLLRRSDERYRNFVEKTSEAVWQIVLKVPMPPGLALQAQVDWIKEHAYVDECNEAYRKMNEAIGSSDAQAREWRADSPWSAVYLQNLENAAKQAYAVDGLQFSVPTAAGRRIYLAGFTGVMVDAALAGIWGVARDITQLVELNESLKLKQARLQVYARQLSGAEERARRSTAVDLHDGIGQQLAGLALTLDASAVYAPPDVRLVLNQATRTLRDIHAMTQRVIADLSPPGLYELGLEAALKWLSVYMRSHDGLQIDLQVGVDDSAFDLDLRILAFKLIRELLRNVVKHSGVTAAKVRVSMTAAELFIDVSDQGVGFEWQLSLFEARDGGFGLWSIAERVREAAGELNVDTAPGLGCSVSITLPLKRERADRRFGFGGPRAGELDARAGSKAQAG
jgi:signal transduction histidine kinase